MNNYTKPNRDLKKIYELFGSFSDFGSQHTVVIFDEVLGPLGCGVLLKINGEHLLATNWHIISKIPVEERIKRLSIQRKQGGITWHGIAEIWDDGNEVDLACARLKALPSDFGKKFVPETNFDQNCECLDSDSTILLYSFPSEEKQCDWNNRLVEAKTLPYYTYALRYENGYVEFDLHTTGLTKEGIEIQIPEFYGSSGSWMWTVDGYDFRLSGIVTYGEKGKSGTASALKHWVELYERGPKR
ncbi:MAG: hypothetical protein HW415_1780 [Deltaproteobacteria bacterium]|nr:hypothetical protein [Deltaproteobacteria bacterium]